MPLCGVAEGAAEEPQLEQRLGAERRRVRCLGPGSSSVGRRRGKNASAAGQLSTLERCVREECGVKMRARGW